MDGSALPISDRDTYGEWLALLSVQHGIVDRGQALRAGFTRRQIEYRLSSATWRSVYQGIYVTFSGPLPREARLWAAVRWAGDGAMVSHQTAAEVHGIIDKPLGGIIHVTVPRRRRPAQRKPVRGILVHRSDQSQAQFAGPFNLPRSGVEDTVLDLVATASSFDQAYAWISRAVSRKLVTVSGLRAALTSRHRVRWRNWLNEALEDASDGVHSSLEQRYVRDVERAHGLPRSEHQARRQFGGKTHFRDNWYAMYRLVVEVDGPSYHQVPRTRAVAPTAPSGHQSEDSGSAATSQCGCRSTISEVAASPSGPVGGAEWCGAY